MLSAMARKFHQAGITLPEIYLFKIDGNVMHVKAGATTFDIVYDYQLILSYGWLTYILCALLCTTAIAMVPPNTYRHMVASHPVAHTDSEQPDIAEIVSNHLHTANS